MRRQVTGCTILVACIFIYMHMYDENHLICILWSFLLSQKTDLLSLVAYLAHANLIKHERK
jgi:hypothetical protein